MQTNLLKQKYMAGEVLFVPALLQVLKQKNDYLDTLDTLLAWDKELKHSQKLARRKEMVLREHHGELHRGAEIHLLFEGVCPTCFDDIEPILMTGSAEFLEERGDDAIETRLWNEVPVHAEIGDITFKCPQGHVHSVIKHWDGDWS